MVRDDVDFRQVLSRRHPLCGRLGPAGVLADQQQPLPADGRPGRRPVPAPACWCAPRSLRAPGVPAPATAGVMTTRAAAQAFFVAGTNRAMFRFTMMNHMCKDMEQVHDVHLPPDRIRQDVSRSPGGDSRAVPQQLHRLPQRHGSADAGLRLLRLRRDRPAASQYTDGHGAAEVPHQHGQLQARLRHPERRLGQLLAQGANTVLGWSGSLPGSGTGAKSMGTGAGQQRPVRALPGREGLQDGLPASAGQCRRSHQGQSTSSACSAAAATG